MLPTGSAAKLLVRGLFEKAVSVFWGLHEAASVDTVQMLGHKFWSAVDATTGGGLIDSALAFVRAALPPVCPGHPSDDTVARACAAAAIVGSVSHMSTPEALAEAHSVIADACQSSVEALAAEATFASTVLEPLPGSATATEGVRDRLLTLARSAPSRGPAAPTVHRAAAELARRFTGDSVVHAALKTDAKPLRGGRLTPFAEACVKGPGTALISSEIACTLFAWLEPADCTHLAIRLWDARENSEEAVAAGFTPLHVAASRARTDFIAVYLSEESVDVAAAVNAESRSGYTPLSVCGTRVSGDLSAVVDCSLALVAAGARWGRPCYRSSNALHAAATIGSDDALRRLLAAPGANPEVFDTTDVVRKVIRDCLSVHFARLYNWCEYQRGREAAGWHSLVRSNSCCLCANRCWVVIGSYSLRTVAWLAELGTTTKGGIFSSVRSDGGMVEVVGGGGKGVGMISLKKHPCETAIRALPPHPQLLLLFLPPLSL